MSLFVAGLVVRCALLLIDFSFDVHNHISWAQDLWQVGFSNFYFTPSREVYASLYPNYPPLAMYFFYLIHPLHEIAYNIFWWLNLQFLLFPSKLVLIVQERYFVAATMKIPAVLADLGIAWITYLFAKQLLPKISHKKLLIFPSLVLFNPAFFYNSAFWGQIDAIPIFFVLAATYSMLYSQKYIMSGLLFTAALLVKPTPIVFLPIFTFVFIRRFGILHAAMSFLVSNVFYFAVFMPLLANPLSVLDAYKIYYYQIIQAQSLAFVTNSAINIWAFTRYEGIRDTALFVFNMSYQTVGYILVVLFLALILKMLSEKRDIFFAFFLSSFTFFLFATKMHERYSILILPFLLLASIKHKRYLKWYYILSLFSFANLYFSWPVPRIEALFSVLHTVPVYLTLATIVIMIFFYLLLQFKNTFRIMQEI